MKMYMQNYNETSYLSVFECAKSKKMQEVSCLAPSRLDCPAVITVNTSFVLGMSDQDRNGHNSA